MAGTSRSAPGESFTEKTHAVASSPVRLDGRAPMIA